MRQWIIILIILFISCKESYDVPNHAPGIIKVVNGMLMVAYGEGGLIISNEQTGEFIAQIFPPMEMHSIDDFAVDGELIFVLDSRGRDYLAVFSFIDSDPKLITPPIVVQGGPFNGVAASNGNLVVAGGTTFLNRFIYNTKGELSGPISFGRDRGHPDIILSNDGQVAFISTDFGIGLDIARFGVMSLLIGDQLEIPTILSELGIEESGFTTGVTTPVGFPIQCEVYKEHLLVAHGGGLTIIDLIEGHVFGSQTTLDIGITAIALSVKSDIAYIIGYQEESPYMVSVDLLNASNPIVTERRPLNTNGSIPTSITIGLNDIFISTGSNGIISLPLN